MKRAIAVVCLGCRGSAEMMLAFTSSHSLSFDGEGYLAS